jgi:arsenate reductase
VDDGVRSDDNLINLTLTGAPLNDSHVTAHLPIVAYRFARERLTAAAQAAGRISKAVPEVLFVCVHNAGRSQMAAALLDAQGKGRFMFAPLGAHRPARSMLPSSRQCLR